MKKFKVGDLVYESQSGRTGVIISERLTDHLSSEELQLKFDWFVEVHWISAEKKFSETFYPGSEYVLYNTLKLVSST